MRPAVLAACILASCSKAPAPGEPWFTSDGTQGVAPAVDFGQVLVGDEARRVLTLENRGASAFRVLSVAASAEKTGLFVETFVLPMSIEATDEARLEVGFAPNAAGPAALDVTFELEGATVSQAVVHLAGTAVDPACKVDPTRLDFGTLSLARDATRPITVSNGSGLAWKVLVGDVDGDQAFAIVGDARTLDVPAHGSAQIWIRYAAFDVGAFHAAVPLSGRAHCSPARVELSASAVENTLTFAPATLDFGAVALGSVGSRTAIFSNASSSDVTLSAIAVTTSDLGFSLPKSEALVVQAGGTASVTVEFAPTKEATYTGALNLLTDDISRSSLTIPLSGTGVTP